MSRYENSKELVPVKIEPDEYQERLLGLSQSSLKTTASDYAYTHKFRVSEDSLNLALRIVTSTFLTHLHENGIQPRSQAEVTKLIRESLKERGKWITQANRMVDGLSNQNRVDKLGIEYSKLHRSKDELKNSSRQIEFPQTQELIKLTKTRAEMLPQLANSIIDFELRGQGEGEVRRVKRIMV